MQKGCICKIVLLNIALRIETGRCDGVTLENRLCEFYSENVLEDEYHFMCTCNFMVTSVTLYIL